MIEFSELRPQADTARIPLYRRARDVSNDEMEMLWRGSSGNEVNGISERQNRALVLSNIIIV